MNISIINLTECVPDRLLQTAIRAINRQLREDFAPRWSVHAQLLLEGSCGHDRQLALAPPELRGDAVIWLHDDTLDDAGLHVLQRRSARGLAQACVHTALAAELQEPWSVALSREAMALALDPRGNRLVAGPHPAEDRTVFHWHAAADAVQSECYECDGAAVANFVFPTYFAADGELGSRCDFLGLHDGGRGLAPFGIRPGAWIGFFDPQLGQSVAYAQAGDEAAQARLAARRRFASGRVAAAWHDGPASTPASSSASTRATTRRTGQRFRRIA